MIAHMLSLAKRNSDRFHEGDRAFEQTGKFKFGLSQVFSDYNQVRSKSKEKFKWYKLA
jgi:hypothetical protein